MQRSTTIGFIDGSQDEQRLELSLNQMSDGKLQLGLSEQHYAEGIGWFTQRSLTLDSNQVAQLKRLLGVQNLTVQENTSKKAQTQATLKLHQRPHSDDHSFSEVG